jgi:cytochrome c oxidase assembly protein subunit 15
VLIYGAMLWTALDLLWGRMTAPSGARLQRVSRLAWSLSALVFLMILSGGFVAGIHAGLAYNTFPLMNGSLVPPEIMMLDPWYLNFFNNIATVQFDHRAIAWLLALLVPSLWWMSRAASLASRSRKLVLGMLVMLAIQISLGISTLLMVVPVPLAALHQAGALLLLTFSLTVSHEISRT